MTSTRRPRTRSALASFSIVAALALSSCDSAEQETNAAANAVELARYLPKDTPNIRTIDVIKARDELDLPEDANALPLTKRAFPRPKSPEAQLFEVTSNAYPIVVNAFGTEFNASGASPLDGTLVRAAAGSEQLGIVSTAEPVEDIEGKLGLADYSLDGRIYEAGPKTPGAASRYVADAGSGRLVYADDLKSVKEILRRIGDDASPGPAAEALEPASGSVRLSLLNPDKRSCVTAFAAAMEATGEGAALALSISGDKPETERFEPKALKGVATGTPTVLVDALLVPIRVKKPLRDGLNALQQVQGASRLEELREGSLGEGKPQILPPFKSYNCP